ncbi:hypothetical protein [Dapis sp. BLCC M172]|uniref:hypothetical protein n=1 Tax=Dapis sp. BLCC M172 TaxID=2975281 RepID=UPI003CEFD11F
MKKIVGVWKPNPFFAWVWRPNPYDKILYQVRSFALALSVVRTRAKLQTKTFLLVIIRR